MNDELQVLYVGGYGRSGSTLLDRLLGAGEAIESLGELYRLPLQYNTDSAVCGCRQNVMECPFWKEVFRRLTGSTDGFPADNCPYLSGSPRTSGWAWPGLDFGAFRRFHERFFGVIRDTVDDSVQYVTDTSKTTIDSAFRPFLLQRCGNVSVRLIHLLRDGRACLWSKYKRDRRKQEKFGDKTRPYLERIRSHPILRTGSHWTFANLAAQSFRLQYPSDYLQVRYEELTNRPLRLLGRIQRFLDVDLSPVKRLVYRDRPIPGAHQIDGNRLRLKENLRLHEDKQSWKKQLSNKQQLLFKLFGGFFIHFYGY